MIKNKPITQERLKELLEYNEETGVFTWKKTMSNRSVVGKVAGSINNRYLYRYIRIDCSGYRAHRLAFLYLNGEFPNGEVDHINHNRDDNRISNLRVVDRGEQMRNRRIGKSNKSGVMGVCWDVDRKKWRATITKNKHVIALGRFVDKCDAIAIRRAAEREMGFHKNHGKMT